MPPAIVPNLESGIFVSSSRSWQFHEGLRAPPRLAIGAHHRGCTDRRLRTGYRACQYDGRLSLVQLRGLYLLYSRANLRECSDRGGRFVQVAASLDLHRWRPMQMISIRGYEADSGDIYFFAVQRNPMHDQSLVALFPLSQPPSGCIGMSFSADGLHWSSLFKLRNCPLAPAGRTEDHPVAGGVLNRNGRIYIYLQLSVAGIAPRGSTTRLVRYSVSTARFWALSQRGLHDAAGSRFASHAAVGRGVGRRNAASLQPPRTRTA